VNLYRLGSNCIKMCQTGVQSAFFSPQVGWNVAPTPTPATAVAESWPVNSAYRSGGQVMTKATLSRRRTRRRHVREKATSDHLVRAVYSKGDERGTTHPPVTASGLSVEEQVRKP